MRIFTSILICFFMLSVNAEAKQFKLGANEANYQYTPSNKGVIGIRFEKTVSAYGRSMGTRPRIVQVYPGTPAQRAGIRDGDEILTINGIRTEEFTTQQIYAMLAGQPGTPVYMEIVTQGPYGNAVTREVSVMRMDMNQIPSDDIFRIYRYGY